MRKTTTAVIGGVLAFAFAALAAPEAVHAQEQAEQAETAECTVEVQPNAVQAGERAVALEIRLSQEIGEVTGLTSPDGSGVTLASSDDLARIDMARQTEGQPQPIQMSAEESRSATVWVNTVDATPGSYQVSFDSEQSGCTATLKVEESAGR